MVSYLVTSVKHLLPLVTSLRLCYVEARRPGLFQPFLRILNWNAPHPGDTFHPHIRRLRCPQMQGTKNKTYRLRRLCKHKVQQVNQSFKNMSSCIQFDVAIQEF